jgi:multidrug efflux pump subunit AcrA (membrane-fusion protein)
MKTGHGLIALAAMVLAACGNGKVEPEPIRPVIAMQVQRGAAESRDVYSGEIRARYESDVGFRVGGKLVARLVDAGATVKKGQVLARLDPEDARLAAGAARSQVAAAESDFAMARAEAARYRELLEKNFISASAYDAKQNAFNAAKGRLEQAQSQSAISANQANYTTLVADADGVVRFRFRRTRPGPGGRPAGAQACARRREGSRHQRAREPARALQGRAGRCISLWTRRSAAGV